MFLTGVVNSDVGWSCHRAGLWSMCGAPLDEKERTGFRGAGAGERRGSRGVSPVAGPRSTEGCGEAESTVVWGAVTESLT